ncbi:hypothetical protein BBJ28_00006931 [Nothophytophthora sp. Chile5]|nr:hypothetical protein BBJ28_00006931 [Nothophytophthora sp. Chile5]
MESPPSTAPGVAQSPPLDSRVLANVIRSYEGETLQVSECDSPVYHGKGRLEFRTGFTYTGDFHRGRMHGTGRMEWQSGVVYEGDFTHNEITGSGSYRWPNGSSYVGQVQGGKRHGRGVFLTGDLGVTQQPKVLEDDESVEPTPPQLFGYHSLEEKEETVDPDVEGEGSDPFTLVRAQSNARYDGEWVCGLPHGYGELVFDAARQIRYEGQFVAGKREGQGHMHYSDGSMFVGDWKDDLKCGHGVMTWMIPGDEEDSGPIPIERYDGEWLDDCQQGFGRHVWLRSGLNATPSREKNWYEGEFRAGLRDGNGVFFYANGARYEGEWRANVKDGYGLFFYENGRVFVGLFRQDRSVEGCYATAEIAPKPAEATSELPVAAASPLPSASSSVVGIMLFINDLLPTTGDMAAREKARKAVEHAALRINTDLRTLYRGCIKEMRRASIPGASTTETEDTGTLLEVFECRQLLSQCGFYFTNGQLESFLQSVRRAQRARALACAASQELACHFQQNLPLENCSRSSGDLLDRLEVVPSHQLLLFREFVELLVRIAHWRATTAEIDDTRESEEPASSLAEAFTSLYERMVRERQEAQRDASTSWLTLLRTQLLGKTLHLVFEKHHDRLLRLYTNCLTSPSLRRSSDVQKELEDDEGPSEQANNHLEAAVSIRSLLVMLRNDASKEHPVFTATFHVRDALQALNRAFAVSTPSLKAEQSHQESLDEEPDAFFLSTELAFSEFLDAIAVVLYRKQQMTVEASDQSLKTEAKPSQELPLYALVDHFLQTMTV